MSEFTTRASCAARQNKPTGLPPGSTTDCPLAFFVFVFFSVSSECFHSLDRVLYT